ncbi:MAG: hypothetical protein PH343_09680, partial [Nitrospira sp.]|nr:hypothetical protein [Nitrospira sp.]
MKVKAVEYLANILPDGHLSIPEEIRKKLKHTTKKRVKVSIEIDASQEVNKKHPAFGIWADRLSGDSSGEIAEELRHQIESRAD